MTDPNNPKEAWTAQLSCYRWMLKKALDEDYETAEIILVDPSNIQRVPYRLWDLDRTQKYIYEQLGKLVMVYRHSYIPNVLPEEDQWMCVNCESRNACENVAVERGEMPPNPEDRQPKRGR